jgi:opacity protein-like surface antigen
LKLFLFSMAMAASASLSAQSELQPVEVSPFVGYLFGGTVFKYDEPPPLWIPGNHIADHLNYGLRVGFNATSKIELELQWSHTDTELSIRELDDLTIDYFLASVNYNFCSGETRPYVSAGVGAGLFDGINYSHHTLFTTTFGLGIKQFFTPNLGLRLEARGYASKPDSIIKTTCIGCRNNWFLNGDLTGSVIAAF